MLEQHGRVHVDRAAEEAKVKSMIEALGGEAAYVGMRHWGAVGQSGQVRERQDAR